MRLVQMDSDDDDYLVRPSSKVILVPTSNLCSHECGKGRKGSPRSLGSPYGEYSGEGPRNYLLKGGNRAVEKANADKLAKLSKNTMRDLKVANSTLANELLRIQASGSEVKHAMKEEISRLEDIIQLQQDKLHAAKSKLAREVELRQQEEEKHTARLKEVARRLKEDQVQKLQQLQSEHGSLQQELLLRRNEAAQATDLKHRLAAAEARLDMEASGRNELWQKCRTLESQLQVANDKLVSCSRALRLSEKQITACSDLDQELHSVREQLQDERVAHTRLQTEFAIEKGDAASDRAVLQHQARELEELRSHCDSLEDELEQLRLNHSGARAQLDHVTSELGHYKNRATRAEQEAHEAREALEVQTMTLRRQALAREQRVAAELTAQATSLQSDLDAKCAECADALDQLADAEGHMREMSAQVESLRAQGDALGRQLAAAKEAAAAWGKEKVELQERLEAAEAAKLQKDAALSDLAASHRVKEAAWKKEAAGMSQSIEQWKDMAVTKQKEAENLTRSSSGAAATAYNEVARRTAQISQLQQELEGSRAQLSAAQEGAAAAARKAAAALAGEQEKTVALSRELERLRGDLSMSESSQRAGSAEAAVLRSQVTQLSEQLEEMQLQLSEEQGRVGSLREQLSTLDAERGSAGASYRAQIAELGKALQLEQTVKLELQAELGKAAANSKASEAELQQSKAALNKALLDKSKAEEAAAEAAAAVQASELKAAQLKKENLGLLSDYDAWISNLITRKGSTISSANSSGMLSSGAEAMSAAAKARAALAMSGSGTGPGAAAGGVISPRSRSTSPGRSSNLSNVLKRSTSGAAGGAGGSLSSTLDDKAQAAADLERYDKIAALIESRTKGRSMGVGSTAFMGRALSARQHSFR